MPDYMGSKRKLLPFIFDEVMNHFPDGGSGKRFLDVCAGSGHVSREATHRGFLVDSVDMMSASGCMVKGSIGIGSNTLAKAERCIREMNGLTGVEGFFFRNYSQSAGRAFFTDENAKRIDACRAYIRNCRGRLADYLLYCALEALSRVQNASCVHTAPLREIKERARRPLVVTAEPVWIGEAKAITGDILKVAGHLPPADVAYVDPPYNGRQYVYYYHLYETFVRDDFPEIRGRGGMRAWEDGAKSRFCMKKDCLEFFKQVLAAVPSSLVFISYSSDGLVTRDSLVDAFRSMKCCTQVTLFEMKQKRFRHSSRVVNDSALYEYLFEVHKGK